MSRRSWGFIASMGAAITVVALVLGLLPVTSKGGRDATANPTTTTTTTVVEGKNEPCPNSWRVEQADNGNHRWFQDGIESIRNATDPASARNAAYEWLDKVKRDPQLLQGAASIFLLEEVDVVTLSDGDCMSQAAVSVLIRLEAYFAASQINPSTAPAGGTNTGVNNGGDVNVAVNVGVSGDTKSVQITGPDGKEVHIMARCGNPVLVGAPPPSMPKGPTDEQPTHPGPEAPPTTGLTPKDPTRDVLLNPEVPDQVKGPGTTPVGQDPGPPVAPVDSPSGCNGPCPTTPPPPTPGPGVTVPSTNGGNTGKTAPTTVAPPLAPPVTSSPTGTIPTP